MTSGKFMENAKVCYLVAAYTSTPEKESLLVSLLSKIKESGNDIILIQHNLPPSYIQEMADFFIFDKNNYVIDYYPVKNKSNFKCILYSKIGVPEIGFRISTQYSSDLKYHGFAAMSLFFNGLMFAKTLGYDICHLVEYDTGLETLDEFIENETILKQTDHFSVSYHVNGHSPEMTYCQCSSYNLNSYSFDELDWSQKKELAFQIVDQDRFGANNSMIETAFYELLHKEKNSFRKSHDDFIKNNVKIDLSLTLSEDCVASIPYVDKGTNQVNIFCLYKKKQKEGTRRLMFVVNGNPLYQELASQGNWVFFPICNLDDLETIDFYLDDSLVKRYDFINEIDKIHFSHNSVRLDEDDW